MNKAHTTTKVKREGHSMNTRTRVASMLNWTKRCAIGFIAQPRLYSPVWLEADMKEAIDNYFKLPSRPHENGGDVKSPGKARNPMI